VLFDFVIFLSTFVCCVISECPNYNMIVPLLLTEKLEDLPNKCKLTPGKCTVSEIIRPLIVTLMIAVALFFGQQ